MRMRSVLWSVVVVSILAMKAVESGGKDEMATRHAQWMAKHGRVYGDEPEKQMRFGVFKENMDFIQHFNSNSSASFTLRPNAFADVTNREFNRLTPIPLDHHDNILGDDHQVLSSFCHHRPTNNTITTPNNSTSLPTSLDWRQKGAVNPIQNQGECSVCWAFATASAVESLTFLNTGNLPSVAVDQLVDCVYARQGRSGCNTGFAEDSYAFIIQNGGVATQASYSPGQCNAASLRDAIRGFGRVDPPNDEEALKAAVVRQPVSAVLVSGSREFQFYSGGVFTGSCGDQVNHMATIVGYGTTEEGIDYWLVRNQWSSNWGEAGYIRLLRNSGARGGQCQIASSVTFPY